MQLNSLNAVTPIDGRYYSKTKSFSNYFSEQALIKYRVLVEIKYFIALTKTNISLISDFPKNSIVDIQNIYLNQLFVDLSVSVEASRGAKLGPFLKSLESSTSSLNS